MKTKLIVLGAIALLLLASCTTVDKTFLGHTIASYKSGDTALNYDSSKNQENFKADVELDATGKVTKLHVETTATTPEAAIAAQSAANARMVEALSKALDKLMSIVPLAATAGS